MNKPAARVGDMTAHGGTITGPGCMTVLIGGMPAARLGDMHVCPMVTPGVPPIPHVGGPIALGSTGVLIGGMPAARMGDMAVCVGPPDSIALGCMTVLIGEVGGGGGAGGGGGGAGSGGGSVSAAHAAMISCQMADKEEIEEDLLHSLDAVFTDEAKFPVSGVNYILKCPDNSESKGELNGKIIKRGIAEGSYEITLCAITSARWSKKKATVGETVQMIIETTGIDTIIPAVIVVYVRDSNFSDRFLKVIEVNRNGEKIEEDFTFEIDEEYLNLQAHKCMSGRYSSPIFYFKVIIGSHSQRSDTLVFTDTLKFEAKDEDGKPAKGKKFKIKLPNGELREGKVQDNGNVEIKNVVPGKMDFKIDLQK